MLSGYIEVVCVGYPLLKNIVRRNVILLFVTLEIYSDLFIAKFPHTHKTLAKLLGRIGLL